MLRDLALDNRTATIIQSTTTQSTSLETVKDYYRCFTNSVCFRFTMFVTIIIFILNVIGWATFLILLYAGAANRTIPDENDRKVWIEIASQVLNGLFFIPIIGLLPWRIRDLVLLHLKKYRPRLLKRFHYATNIVWIGIFVWAYIFNAIFQIAIAACLWGIYRDNRPIWLMGILVGLAILTGVTGALIEFILTKRAKKNRDANLTHQK